MSSWASWKPSFWEAGWFALGFTSSNLMLKILRQLCTWGCGNTSRAQFLSLPRAAQVTIGIFNLIMATWCETWDFKHRKGFQWTFIYGCFLSPKPGSVHWQRHRGQHQETTETTWSQRTQDRVCPLTSNFGPWKTTNPTWKLYDILMLLFCFCSLQHGSLGNVDSFGQALWRPRSMNTWT